MVGLDAHVELPVSGTKRLSTEQLSLPCGGSHHVQDSCRSRRIGTGTGERPAIRWLQLRFAVGIEERQRPPIQVAWREPLRKTICR